MSIYRDKTRSCYVFEFDRFIEGKRVRVRKLLPKTWTRAQADAYDRQEAARLYAVATRVERHEYGIEDAVAVYLKERVPKLKSKDNIIGELAQMFWVYQGRALADLPEVCKEYAAKARKDDGEPLSAATIRNRIRYLTSACRYAWKHNGMCEHDPAARVIVPTVRNERRFFIDRQQMLEVARACRCRSTRAAIRIAFYSGMRLGEVIAARRTEAAFILDDTKNGEPRHVPVHPRIRACLKVRMRESSKMSKYFREARRAVGMDWLHFHDLRHSAASEMINAGVDLYTVGAVLGHKSATSTKRYSHLATDSLRVALDKIGRRAA